MNRRTALLILLTGVLVTVVGCKTTVIEPGTDRSATYSMGKLKATIPHDIAAVYQATDKAMSDLGLSVVQSLQDALEAKVVARDAQDKKITVTLVSAAKDLTDVTINVGSMDKARRIHQAIHDNLQ
jgi:hypothetical protein